MPTVRSEEPGIHAEDGLRQWWLLRRCSLTPRQVLLSYAVLVAISVAVALYFGWLGFWVIPLWCGLQVMLAGAMYLCYLIHAIDGERITVTARGDMAIEVTRGLTTRRHVLPLAWARLEREAQGSGRLWLCCHGQRVEVATQLRSRERRHVERELRQCLHAAQSADGDSRLPLAWSFDRCRNG